MIVPRDRVRVEGELRVYESVGGSGRTFRRHFCPNCGSSVFGEGTVRPGTINIMAGTLDDPSAYRPASEIFCDFAVPWLEGRDSRNRLPQGFYGPRTEP
jgi:hypothetical protein